MKKIIKYLSFLISTYNSMNIDKKEFNDRSFNKNNKCVKINKKNNNSYGIFQQFGEKNQQLTMKDIVNPIIIEGLIILSSYELINFIFDYNVNLIFNNISMGFTFLFLILT